MCQTICEPYMSVRKSFRAIRLAGAPISYMGAGPESGYFSVQEAPFRVKRIPIVKLCYSVHSSSRSLYLPKKMIRVPLYLHEKIFLEKYGGLYIFRIRASS